MPSLFSTSIGWRLFLAAISSLPALTSAAEASKGWPADLDWAPLEARLSDAASLIDTSFADWQSECLPEYSVPLGERTNHALIDQPSGMCVDQLFCAYERCHPRPDADGHAGTTLSQRLNDTTYHAELEELSPEVRGWLADPANPALNLPSKVIFPAVASDVIAAVDFARGNGLEVSVKNSGHSFIGASTKRDTLHVNMNRFARYAPTGIVGCEGDDGPVCALAKARGKPGYIRVGGGENWDKTYRAVGEFNKAQGNKYHVVGGAAGTVSPMGWTFQGGLGGTSGGRTHGFGVDQILRVEMVLPNGLHVRFGPTAWEDAAADGSVAAPRTTIVAGQCRANPDEADEGAWEWGACPYEDAGVIDFGDLWYAVAGGGGGTWGVVTSLCLQLHDYVPPFSYGFFQGFPWFPGGCDEVLPAFIYIFETFRATYLLKPSLLNVTQASSNACGSPDGVTLLSCFGEGPFQDMLNAWKSYLAIHQDQLTDGVTVDDVLACGTEFDIPFDEIIAFERGHPYAGKVVDIPPPTIQAGANEESLNVLVPKEFLENNIDWYLQTFVFASAPGAPYYAFGSGTSAASDQANSLSSAHRGAGVKVYLPPDWFYSDLFPDWYDLSDNSNFPGFLGSNHVGNTMMGPRKDDWTKECPREWTQREREEKCISIQEAIYGTKTLRRLEAIKEALDPNYVFDCNGCIGNNRVKDAPDTPTPSPPTADKPPAETNPKPTAAVADPPSETPPAEATPNPTVTVAETPAETTPNPTVVSAASNLPAMSLSLVFLLGQLIAF